MRAMRLVPAIALALAVVTGPASALTPAGSMRSPERSATAGTRSGQLDLLRDSIEAAGGVTLVEEGSATTDPGPIGGYWAYPLLNLDLNGDGTEETLLDQEGDDLDGPDAHLVAVSERRILWREDLGGASLLGAIPAELSSARGREALVFLYRWDGGIAMAAAGAKGFLWELAFGSEYDGFTGLAQADGDPEREIAVLMEDGVDSLKMRVIDGERGTALRDIHPSLDGLPLNVRTTNAFVTDGLLGRPDEAVFITPLAAGYYAERRSLADGTRTAAQLMPTETSWWLWQGPDYTGDGRRDAYIYDWAPVGDNVIVGVFDALTLRPAWTLEVEVDRFAFVDFPLSFGDVNSDGAEDPCIDHTTWADSASTTVACFGGLTGLRLWSASLTAPGYFGWTEAPWVRGDIDGDGVIDPTIVADGYECEPGQETCETFVDAVAYSGATGRVLWHRSGYEGIDLAYSVTPAELDATRGDDAFVWSDEIADPPGARFSVLNGRALAESWRGLVETGIVDSFADYATDPDVDGDGSSEVLLTVSASRGIGPPLRCETWEGREYCEYADYETFVYAAAFEPDGRFLWRIEL